MNPQDIRTLVNQLTLLEAGEPTNPSRRGFLKKAGAGVAVASAASLDPTGTIVKGLVKDLGFDNLSALDQLLKVATPDDVLGFFKYRLSSGIWEDAITDEEFKLAQQALPDEYVSDWVTDQFDNDKDGLEELSKLIGRPLTMDKIAKVLDKNQIDYDDPEDGELLKLNDSLSDLAYGKNNWIDAQDAGKNPAQSSGSIDPEKEVVKSNSIRTLIRLAAVMAKNLLTAKPEIPPAAPTPVDNKINTPALPPPSKSEYDDLLTPNLDKEKPEFDYWKPGEEDPKQLKKKNQ
jgi:hypothetical protein